jgi:hypothetical protein
MSSPKAASTAAICFSNPRFLAVDVEEWSENVTTGLLLGVAFGIRRLPSMKLRNS